ncbi:MAG: NusG domain II-containing protein [Oscillospiraceae bacterium]|nr:NusG domain II-containing protein [Oscillospiraceae bacterium]
MKKKRLLADILLIAGVLIAAAVVWLLLPRGGGGAAAVVTVNGEHYASLPLSEDAELLIRSDDGGENLLVISGGKARVTESNCPNGVCVETGAVSSEGQLIVCLPHKVVIEIVG